MTAAADAFTDLVLEVFRLNGRLLAAGDRLAAPVGLTRQSVQRTVDVLAVEGAVAFAPKTRSTAGPSWSD